MYSRRLTGFDGLLYDERTQAAFATFDQLREVLLDVGFVVNRRSPREGTLRVYPVKHRVYPLLNPTFYTDDKTEEGDGSSEMLNGESFPEEGIRFVVLSPLNDHERTTELLSRFDSRETCYWQSSEGPAERYWFHGEMFVPLTFNGPLEASAVDFEALKEPLTHLFLSLRD